jgi:protein associated with RNAse G/E
MRTSNGSDPIRVRVQSTKYDGSLHNDYGAYLLDGGGDAAGTEGASNEGGHPLRLHVPAGTRIESYRGRYDTSVAFTALFWPGAEVWWNVYHNHAPAGRRGFVSYANVSTPASFDGESVRWVDLDLDVVVMPGRVELDDEDEFEAHRLRFANPPDIEARAREAASELLERAARLSPPFDREAYIPRLD